MNVSHIAPVLLAWMAIPLSCSSLGQANIQLGIRLDSKSSLQWSSSQLFLEADERVLLKTSVKEIYDVWPGPVQGIFGISSSEGVGILLGQDVLSGGHLFGENSIIRSSRYNTLWACWTDIAGGKIESTIAEWYPNRTSREIVRVADRIVDFDVDVSGKALYLLENGSIYFSAGDGPVSVQVPREFSQPQPRRVFLSANSSEFAVYTIGRLLRFNTTTKSWSAYAVDPDRHALVRHVWSRRIRIEERFPN